VNLDKIIDFATEAHRQIGKYMVTVTLSPEKMMKEDYNFNSLCWDSIPYGDAELDKVPGNKRGVYAFAVCQNSKVLPPHCYVLYIGIAGKDSNRPLKDRYKDYLNERKVLKRAGIARMIADWHNVLRFFFAPVGNNVSSQDLKTIEKQLNTALLPPFSEGDLEADTKRKRKAFK
jgi:hypothetical protein